MGFLEEDVARAYLEQVCLCDDSSPEALRAHWREARRRLGPPGPHPGRPEVSEIPGSYRGHLGYVLRDVQFRETFPGADYSSFKIVEIAPLLAWQIHVSAEHSRGDAPAALREQIKLCLPSAVGSVPPRFGQDSKGFYLESEDIKIDIFPRLEAIVHPRSNRRVLAMPYGLRAPWVQVLKVGERYFLFNGYHRAHRLLAGGVERMPCLLLDAPDLSPLPIERGTTFDHDTLLSENPPTCGHFTAGRAYSVPLRKITVRVRPTVTIERLRE